MLKTTRTKLKILFVLHTPNPFPRAVWSRISFFAQFLKDKGHEVSFNCAFSFKTLNRFGVTNWRGLKLYTITPIIMVNNTFSSILNILSSVLTTFLMIIFKRPHVIVISIPRGETAFGSCLVALALRKKIIIDYRDEWEDYLINTSKNENYKRFIKYLKKRMTKYYLKSSQVITVTEPLVNNLKKRGITNVRLITNGADTKIFKPRDKIKLRKEMGFEKNDFIFIYSGGMAEYYRLDLVVNSIGKLIQKKKNVKLLLVGHGPFLEDLKKLIVKNGLQNYIIYLGEVTEKLELAKILSASDVGIVPFDANPLWKNALPSKALEYFACGLPVVATIFNDSILGKMITENKLGLICEPENVTALTNSLEKICNDALLTKTAQERGCKLIQERFDRNKLAQEFVNLFEEL